MKEWRAGSADVGHGNQVGKDARRRHGSSCAIALDAHGIFPVARRGEEDDVVAPLKVIEGMRTIYLFKPYAGFAVGKARDEAEMMARGFGLTAELLEAGIFGLDRVSLQRGHRGGKDASGHLRN